MRTIDYTRLEVNVGGTWTNLTGSARTITIDRGDGDVGLMSAEVLNSTLDPVTNTTLRLGREVRVSVKNGASWAVQFQGRIDSVSVDYDPLASGTKTANIKISASDAVALLANAKESRGVGTINELRWIVTGVPFNINGATTPLATGTVVATNDNASLWDQILITRDSKQGYAWVDKTGTLRVYDTANMVTTIAGTFNESVYSSVDVDFSLDQIINSVTVQWLRYDIGTETATAVAYGPYEDATSIADWGVRSATFTVQGPTEVAADIAAFANDVLTRNKTAEHRARSAVVPIRVEADLALVRNIDLNSRVSVVYNGTTKTLRVVGIKHTMVADKWDVEFEFALPNGLTVPSVTPTTGIGFTPPGSIGAEELDADTNTAISDAAALAQQALTEAEASFDYAQTRNKTYYQAAQPTGGTYTNGDIWFDTDDNNQIYVYQSGAWTSARDLLINDAVADAAAAQAQASQAISDAEDAFNAANTANNQVNAWKYTGTTNIDGGDVQTDTIGEVQISANAITAKHTLTGPLIQTTATASRGIKLNSAALIAYDSSGVATFSIDANSGSVSMLGSLTSGSTVTGATITGGLFQTTATANRGIKISSTTLYAYDGTGSPTLSINASTGSVILKGSLTSGSDVTGATITASSTGVIQTESTSSRGIKMNSAGFTAYDSSGSPTFTITASSGAVAMKGTLTAGSSITGTSITASSFATAASGMRIELSSNYQNYIRFVGGDSLLANTVAGVMGQTVSGESMIRIMPQLWQGQDTSYFARIDVVNYRSPSTGAIDYFLDFHGDAFFQNDVRTDKVTSKSGGTLNLADSSTPVNAPSLVKSGKHTVTITAANTNFTRSVSFPVAFPASGPVPLVVATPYDITGNVTMKVAVRNVTRNGFDIDVVRSSGTTNVDVAWIAVAQ